MSAIALLLAGAVLVLAGLREFHGGHELIEFILMLVIVSLMLPAQFARLKYQAEKRRAVKSTRDSLQKHFWELRHNREW